ncbi:MAG: exodeoxyribonuclease V subunit alpha [Candidatus Sedimenticola endophacoides]|uniref:RecBCD enzyme subunit RecD n=2 Tax=Candidatus Sedimenticola endophacoides TaxID=2548426 RepID=A0A6N4E0N3_9GAMM|nr:MAG: exodeoxyribonuclease V subunit alpha [Candidatus Sedimenticola endophacoides]OQX41737.1 MAG: exodeoxyribonuclease V subunit alpha [Candidatus Sedimenticola endophacoides]PUD99141.1 MAG: exodeoxyribonuclease V subunit alpha [Candidatus Sedimenticola endophacoides]PUE02693.1 MAG: exodeoxyribonuclease V subunit alpha [Candidatus Sedimenticola endophacoides]PUE04654.1 MAG: exodeoxyribonuclease V subunit alpha [Candidatus Sedimenticola endophacoides]
MSRALDRLYRQRLIGDLDLHFARLIQRLDGGENEPLGLAAALVSSRVQQGDICIDLAALAGTRPGDSREIQLPSLEEWLNALHASAVTGAPGSFAPLILDRHHQLYLYRYWDYERQLGAQLLARARLFSPAPDRGALIEGVLRLFPPASSHTDIDWQRVAALSAALRHLTIISGGPGTGKTTTVIRILALLAMLQERPPVVALAAPTGKAAARLEASLRDAASSLAELPEPVLRAIPRRASTLHRLLGVRGSGVGFHHGPEHPLALDVLVVDEASMVDLALMSKLLQALPAHARLILLGDHNQLASVEAGAVLGDICAGAGGYSTAYREQLAQLCGADLNPMDGSAGGLDDSIVLLRHSYRFGRDSGIGRLAEAVIAGDGAAVARLLEGGPHADLTLTDPHSEPARLAADGLVPYFKAIASGAPVAELFTAFDRFRALCPTRVGLLGSDRLNRRIERELVRRGLVDPTRDWYPGRAVMITRNDYSLQLYNGDVGLVLEGDGGHPMVCFQTPDGGVRAVAPARLPEHQPVYAMTIHKSQGSEFDQVLMVLPQQMIPTLTRELIYTAVTRARSRFILSGDVQLLVQGVARDTLRHSGLRRLLRPENG